MHKRNPLLSRKLATILLALAMLFSISIAAVAAGGNAGEQPNMAGTGFQIGLTDPAVTMSPGGGTYVLTDEYDATSDIVFTFNLNPMGGQKGFGIYPGTDGGPGGFDGVKIYEKGDATQTAVVSLGGNYSQETINPNFFFSEIDQSPTYSHLGFENANPQKFGNERTSKLTIKANVLESGKTYCLFFPKTIKTFNNGSSHTFGSDVTIEFKTKSADTPLTNDTIPLKNESTGQTGSFKFIATMIDSQGAQKNSVVLATDGSEYPKHFVIQDPVPMEGLFRIQVTNSCVNGGKKFSDLYVKVYIKATGELLKMDDQTGTYGDYWINDTDNANLQTGQYYAMDPSSWLQPGTEYYFVMDKTSTEGGNMPFGEDLVFEFKTDGEAQPAHTHTEEIMPAKEATCTETGLTEGKKCSVCGEILEEQEEIPALGHTEEVVKGKEATCTEKGLTDGKKCSVCGEVLGEQKEVAAKGHTEKVIPAKDATCTMAGQKEGKECSVCGEVLVEPEAIPAKGHTEEVIKGKAATCTEKGLTDGKKCSVCGTILKVREDIPALGHDYKDGKCTRCGETDPNYKPAEPVEPSDTKLVVKNVNGEFIAVRGTKSTTKASDYTGIAPEVDNRKVWWRVVDGDVVPNATGVFKNEYGWWRVENGTVNFKAQEIYKNQYGWWKTTNGKVTFKETGVFKNRYGWWRVEDSKVNFKANGIYKNQYGWWKTTKGKVTFKENGVFKNEYGWWKVENSKVNFKFTGIAKNEYGTWYVKNGKVDFSKNGKVAYNGKTYQVTNGKAKTL